MRGALAALVLAVVCWQPALAQQLLSPSEFRDAAIALIRAADPRAEIEVRDELGINVRRAHEAALPEYFVNFDAAYREYEADPSALTDILDRWVRFAASPPEQSQMAERIVSVLRTHDLIRAYDQEAARARAASGLAPSRMVWRPFAGDLVEIIVFDGAETIQYATEETLAEIGVSPERAWRLAPENLPARIGELELGGVGGADRLVFVTGGNGLAPSSLTNGGVCNGATDRFAFLVVDRNGYVAADRDDSVAFTQFRALLDDLRREGGSLSLTPLACHNGRVVELQLTD